MEVNNRRTAKLLAVCGFTILSFVGLCAYVAAISDFAIFVGNDVVSLSGLSIAAVAAAALVALIVAIAAVAAAVVFWSNQIRYWRTRGGDIQALVFGQDGCACTVIFVAPEVFRATLRWPIKQKFRVLHGEGFINDISTTQIQGIELDPADPVVVTSFSKKPLVLFSFR